MTNSPDHQAALVASLERAYGTFSSRPVLDTELENPAREGTEEALKAVIEYLGEIGVDLRLRTPLLDLVAALSDADAGRSNPLTAPRKTDEDDVRKREKKPAKEVTQHAFASAVVTMLREDAKCSLSDAEKTAAEAIGLEPSALKNFRKNVMSDIRNGRSERASESSVLEYRSALAEFRRLRAPDVSAADAAEILLRYAKAMSGQKV